MSLRLSSLDPNQPRAAKDCRTCNRRRIRCDRSLPTCKKCALKGLACPGYGLRIQWDQGVASRGRFTGKTLPVLGPGPLPAGLDQEGHPPGLIRAESSDTRVEPVHFAEHDPMTVPLTFRSAFHPFYDENQFRNKFALNLDLSPYALPPYLQTQSVRHLIHYYDNVVAVIMPWVDGPDNGWRELILPLAMESESLLLATLALSAEHYASKNGSTWATETGTLSSQYRDKSLRLLAQNLRIETGEDASTGHQGPASAMLATILLLCNIEMIRMDSAIWRVHWKAARTITRRLTSSSHTTAGLDATCRFLVKEAFVYDVFGSSTTFDGQDQISGWLLAEEHSNVFTKWLQLVQEVTRVERCRNDHLPLEDSPLRMADVYSLQGQFDDARTRSLNFSRAWDFGTASVQNDFVVLIDIFHYAGLLYSYQALLDRHASAPGREACVRAVIRSMGLIKNSSAFQHDLVWPLFMVGAEGRQNEETQKFADARLLEAMRSTGFSNCYPALEFLRRFWATDSTVAADWIQFARQESRKGLNFLVI